VSFLTAIVLVSAYIALGDPKTFGSSPHPSGATLAGLVSDLDFKNERGPLSDAVQQVVERESEQLRTDTQSPSNIRAGNNPDLDPGAYVPEEVEQEIDRMRLSDDDRKMIDAFPASPAGNTLRRYVFMKRYPEQVPGAARLELDYFNGMMEDPTSTLQTIAAILKELPKSQFREEHVTLRSLADQLPGGHDQLQVLLPDADFK
jgi:hypothetical protein